MINREQKISWRTAWLQFLCETNGIEYTGQERREELEVKLTNAGIPIVPLSPPSVYTAVGTTNNPNTSIIFSGSPYVLPDPRVSISMKKNQKAVISGFVCCNTNTHAENGIRMVSLVISTNGGSSWTNLGSWANATSPGNNVVPVPLGFAYTSNADRDVIFGIRIASSDGSTVVTATNNQRSLVVTVY